MSKQSSDVTDLHMTGMQTILEYPDDWIHVYTDGSAMKGTRNAGYGARIEYPDKSFKEIANPCGTLCSNFDAETIAIESALTEIEKYLKARPENVAKIVVFSDSKSVLECLSNGSQPTKAIKKPHNHYE